MSGQTHRNDLIVMENYRRSLIDDIFMSRKRLAEAFSVPFDPENYTVHSADELYSEYNDLLNSLCTVDTIIDAFFKSREDMVKAHSDKY